LVCRLEHDRPPALAFANTIVGRTPAISYTSVCPLTVMAGITVAQVLVILVAG
jgi:uncharacterized transporter YbjL